jgi:hypothetical protein
VLRVLIAVATASVIAASCSSSGSAGGSRPRTVSSRTHHRLDSTLRLDQVQVLGSHNSYHGRPYAQVLAALRKGNPALADSLDYAHAPLPQQFDIGVRQIELDVYADPQGGKYARPSFPLSLGVPVADDPVMHQPGFKVIHQSDIDTNSTCLTFVRCLSLVKQWSDAHPGHVPLDVHVEMKDSKVDESTFAALEREIRSVFPSRQILTPDLVRGDAPTLGAAVSAHGWPTLGRIRGRVYFTLDNEAFRSAYLVGHPSLRGRLLFTPSHPGAEDAAFAKLNDPVADAAAITAALDAHMIVRTRADADTFQARSNNISTREAALRGGAQLVSTDYERLDPTLHTGYVVHIPGGTPARCDPVTAPPHCRPSDVEDPALLRG